MEGSNTVIDNRPSVKVFMTVITFLKLILSVSFLESKRKASPMMFRQSIAVPY